MSDAVRLGRGTDPATGLRLSREDHESQVGLCCGRGERRVAEGAGKVAKDVIRGTTRPVLVHRHGAGSGEGAQYQTDFAVIDPLRAALGSRLEAVVRIRKAG